MERSRSESYKAALIGEYDLAAKYWRTQAKLRQQQLDKYAYTPDEIPRVLREIEEALYNASDFQTRADELKGDTNGIEESTFSTAVSSRLHRAFEQITCTTVL